MSQYDDFHPVYRRQLAVARWGFEAGFLFGVKFRGDLPEDLDDYFHESDEESIQRLLLQACELNLQRWSRDIGHAVDTTASRMSEIGE